MTGSPQLALLGGTPVSSTPLAPPAWPVVSEETGDRLKALYLSRQWSFNCPAEQEFARDFAAAHDAPHGIFMINGTATLHCALAALGIGQGDEVIVPALTWPATAMAAHYLGATPVFVDVEPDTLCLDPTKIEAAITPRTCAIIPVHLYASMADMDAILAIARKHNLRVIEDCAHMHGGQWAGQGIGSIGDIGSFSFQQSKTMASGEGGICLTRDPALAERLFRLKHIGYLPGNAQGQASAPPPADLLCYNFRATGFQAVILQDQLQGLIPRIEQYGRNLTHLRQRLADAPGVRLQAPGRRATRQGIYAVAIIFDGEITGQVPRQVLADALAAEGLTVGATYGPVYRHRLYNVAPSQYRIAPEGCPVAETLGSDRAFQIIHNWFAAPEDDLRRIADILIKVAAQAHTLLTYQPASV